METKETTRATNGGRRYKALVQMRLRLPKKTCWPRIHTTTAARSRHASPGQMNQTCWIGKKTRRVEIKVFPPTFNPAHPLFFNSHLTPQQPSAGIIVFPSARGAERKANAMTPKPAPSRSPTATTIHLLPSLSLLPSPYHLRPSKCLRATF